MKARPIDQIVYEYMFPKPKQPDPQNFQSFLQKSLITEVRQETQCFYGSLDSREAQYPGLDYSHYPHRMRLSRFPWHRRLFRAFDALRLTKSEIAELTKWEGTRWAKEQFEKEQGIKIRDTTGDCIHDWVDPRMREHVRVLPQPQEAAVEQMVDVDEGDTEGMDEDVDESDMEIESVGVELNERLRAAVAARAAGSDAIMDAEWEQWLKDAVEAGGLSFPPNQLLVSADADGGSEASLSTIMTSRVLDAARLGPLREVPSNLHEAVRQRVTSYIRTENSSSSIQRRPVPDQLSRIQPTAPLNIQQQRQPTSPIIPARRVALGGSRFTSGDSLIRSRYTTGSTQPP